MQSILVPVVLAAFLVAPSPASAARPSGVPPSSERSSSTSTVEPDSSRLEKELQGLSWRQFRSVVESVPQLKSAVDAYGAAGWQFVQANYRQYGWRRNIDKLNIEQKRELAARIERARSLR